jgi:hypothetical protein
MKPAELPVLWALFFLTTVYGHVALKFAVDGPGRTLARVFATMWGWSALAAWAASCLLWAAVLSRQQLLSANSVASLRYVLICLLIAAGTWLAK